MIIVVIIVIGKHPAHFESSSTKSERVSLLRYIFYIVLRYRIVGFETLYNTERVSRDKPIKSAF